MQRQFVWTEQHDGLLGIGGRGFDRYEFDVPPGYEFVRCEARVVAGRYAPGVQITQRPSPGDRKSNRKIQVQWWFDGGPRPFIKYKLTAVVRTASAIDKGKRALLVVSDLAHLGTEKLKWLYEWLDSNGVQAIKQILHDDYRSVAELLEEDATISNFVGRLTSLAGDPRNEAVDLVLMLHGLPGVLCFRGGDISLNALRERIQEQYLQNRLRACFSTACFGGTHAPKWVDAGFRVACGARGSYANGAYGLGIALLKWAEGARFSDTVKAANNLAVIAICDSLARMEGFDDADSQWIVAGKANTRITSEAR